MRHGKISPDSEWIAFVSGESGRNEICVQPVPGLGREGKWQISAAGGEQPVWRADGSELYFLASGEDGGQLMAIDITLGGTVEAGVPEVLLDVPGLSSTRVRYSVTRDGQRFLFPTLVDDATSFLTVDTDWLAGRN